MTPHEITQSNGNVTEVTSGRIPSNTLPEDEHIKCDRCGKRAKSFGHNYSLCEEHYVDEKKFLIDAVKQFNLSTPFTGILKEYSGFIHAGVARQLQSAHEREIDKAKGELLQSLIKEVEELKEPKFDTFSAQFAWKKKNRGTANDHFNEGCDLTVNHVLALLRKRLQ